MSNYRKTMAQALREVYLVEDNVALMRKAAGGAMQTIKFKDGKQKMDSFSASAIMKVFDAVNPKNRKSMETIINKGTVAQMLKLQSFAMKQIKSEFDPEDEEDEEEIRQQSEEVELNEASEKDILAALKKERISGYFSGSTLYVAQRALETARDLLRGMKLKSMPKLVGEHKGTKPHKHPHPEKGPLAQVDEKFTKKDFDDNEDNNEHTLNAVELVKMFGDNYEKRQIAQIKKDHDKNRHIVMKDRKVRDALIIKYHPKLKEEVELDEQKFDVKTAETKKGKITVNSFANLEAAKKYLEYMQKRGHKGIISQGGRTVKEEVELDEVIGAIAGIGRAVVGGAARVAARAGSAVVKKAKSAGQTTGAIAGHGIEKGQKKAKTLLKKKEEEIGLDEGSFSDVIVMGKGRVTKSVLPDAREIKKLEKEGWKIQGVIEKGSKILHKDPKRIMKAIKGGDKLGIGESLEEGKMKELHGYIQQKKSAEWIAKTMGLDVKTIKSLMASYNYEEVVKEGAWQLPVGPKGRAGLKKLLKKPVKAKDSIDAIDPYIGDDELWDDLGELDDEDPNQDVRPTIRAAMKRLGIKEEALDESQRGTGNVHGFQAIMKDADDEDEERKNEASAAADAKRAISRDKDFGKKRDRADVDDVATDDDIKGASKNIMMQMRKSMSLRGNFPVEFMDRKKVKVDSKIAAAVTAKFMALKRPAEKQAFQSKVSKSYKDMLAAVNEALKEAKSTTKETILERIDRKLMERKNG